MEIQAARTELIIFKKKTEFKDSHFPVSKLQ